MTLRPANPKIAELTPYDPKYLPADVQISANESTEDVPQLVRRAAMEALAATPFNRYGDALANSLREELAAWHGVTKDQVLVGDGGDELLFDVALAWANTGALLNIPPTFGSMAYDCALLGTPVIDVPRGPEFEFPAVEVLARAAQDDIGIVLVTNPNNPTGDLLPVSYIDKLCAATNALVLVDEAYIEFAPTGASAASLLDAHDNLAILHTLSKLFSLAGVRVGYLLASEHIIDELMKVRQPYSVSVLDQAVALAAVRNREAFELRQVRTISQRQRLYEAIAKMPHVHPFPSQTNFVFVRFDEEVDAAEVWQQLYARGILVRDFSQGTHTKNCLRISCGTAKEVDATIAALQDILQP